MIRLLEGVLEEKQPTRVVLLAGGVGYEVGIPLGSYERLPAEGATCRLLIYDWVREGAHDLYGFATPEERRLFAMLLGVGGIGPKTALNALSGLSPGELSAAIAGGDVRRLSSISGIGRKTAERIVVELRDRLAEDLGTGASGMGGGAGPGDVRRDAVSALVSLGYKPAEAVRLVRAAAPETGDGARVEEIVRRALGSVRPSAP